MRDTVRSKLGLLFVLTAFVLLAAGCAPAEPTQRGDSQPPPAVSPEGEAEPGDSGPEEPGQSANEIVWLDTQLKDAVTGEAFTLADYKGKPVLLHSFAVW